MFDKMNNSSSLSLPSLLHSDADGDTWTDTDSNSTDSDIVDRDCDPPFEIPARPTSRLGFNNEDDEDDEKDPAEDTSLKNLPRSRSVTLKWTRSLFQRIGISSLSTDADVSVSTSKMDDFEDVDIDENGTSSSDDDEHSDGSLSEDIDGDSTSDLLLFPPPPRPSTQFPIISSPALHLPLPVLVPTPPTPIPATSPPAPAPPRPSRQFCALPSPLSPHQRYSYSFVPTIHPARHDYTHHGLSRHALLHLKWFWAVREEEWAEEYARLSDEAGDELHHVPTEDEEDEANAYGGITPPSPPRRSLPTATQTSTSPTDPPPSPPLALPLTMHPRLGDLSALRDPYCAHIDRFFAGLGVGAWTLAKTIWMFDVGVCVEFEKMRFAGPDPTDKATSEKEKLMRMVTSRSTNESDVTLVDVDLGGECDLTMEAEMVEIDLREPGDVSIPSAPKALPKSSSTSKLDDNDGASTCPPWETSWYKRWQLLVELVRLDRERAKGNTEMEIPHPATSTFYIEDQEEQEDDSEEAESWDETQWDACVEDVEREETTTPVFLTRSLPSMRGRLVRGLTI